jgi:hypothetical protein
MFATYASAAPGGAYIVPWGAILYGVVKILGDLADVRDDDGAPLSYGDRVALGKEMTLRAMFFIAREAGGISDERAATIDEVLWRITDREYPADRLAALRADSLEGDAFLDRLRAERSRIAPSFPEIILDAAARVALAHGPIEPRVRGKLFALAEALKLDGAAVSAAIETAQQPRSGRD